MAQEVRERETNEIDAERFIIPEGENKGDLVIHESDTAWVQSDTVWDNVQ